MIKTVAGLLSSLSEALFPACCEVCGQSLVDGEELLCLQCRHSMPRAKIHNDSFNILHQRLASPGIPIRRAASYFFYYRDNPYARLIQKAKYNNRPAIARHLGAEFAREISPDGFFDDIDALLPIPLHFFKKFRRGYNQSEEICRGISSVTGIPIADNLRIRHHSTQTRKNAFLRHLNVEGIMWFIEPDELAGKHILLVDDVITTGATMLNACKTAVSSVPCVRLSVLSLGLTHQM